MKIKKGEECFDFNRNAIAWEQKDLKIKILKRFYKKSLITKSNDAIIHAK